MEEVEVFKEEALAPIGHMGEAIQELAQENIIEAKADEDMPKLERSVATLTKGKIATNDINRLEDMSFSKLEEPAFSFDLEHIISALMGGGGMMTILSALFLPKIKRLKTKAQEYAQSTEVNDIKNDKDLA